MTTSVVPELMPVLSRGKHRTPRKGACFMEMASFLAGEPWSDHPSCTHPLLAALARLVNDATTDAHRQDLAGLVPDVIGLTSDDRCVDLRIALRAAIAALPVAAEERQRVLAVAVVATSRALRELNGLAPDDDLSERGRRALDQAPGSRRWAEQFAGRSLTSTDALLRNGAPATVRFAVDGIAQACVPDPDRRLGDLLREVIADCRAWIGEGIETPAREPDSGQPPAIGSPLVGASSPRRWRFGSQRTR
jgi:hypothetical protein